MVNVNIYSTFRAAQNRKLWAAIVRAVVV